MRREPPPRPGCLRWGRGKPTLWGPLGMGGGVSLGAVGCRGCAPPHVTPSPPQDGQLTREEILGQWELFVGSRATDYGNALEWRHDEL